MFEALPESRKIKIGQIAFLVLAALPIGIFIRLLTFDAETKAEGWEGLMLVFLSTMLSLLFAAFGAIVIIWKARQRDPFLFYLCSTIVVAIPGLYFGIMFLWIYLFTHFTK